MELLDGPPALRSVSLTVGSDSFVDARLKSFGDALSAALVSVISPRWRLPPGRPVIEFIDDVTAGSTTTEINGIPGWPGRTSMSPDPGPGSQALTGCSLSTFNDFDGDIDGGAVAGSAGSMIASDISASEAVNVRKRM